jgi:hypothetical protein
MDRDQSEELLKTLRKLEDNTSSIPAHLEDMVDILERFIRIYEEETA